MMRIFQFVEDEVFSLAKLDEKKFVRGLSNP
jgi:hypothetical protein